MTLSKAIGYVLIAAGLLVGVFGVWMMSINEFGAIFGFFIVLGALVLLGIGAIAVKK